MIASVPPSFWGNLGSYSRFDEMDQPNSSCLHALLAPWAFAPSYILELTNQPDAGEGTDGSLVGRCSHDDFLR